MSHIFPTLNGSERGGEIRSPVTALFQVEIAARPQGIAIHQAKRRDNMKPIFTLVIAVAGTLASHTMTVAAPIVVPSSFLEIAGGATKIDALTVSNKHQHIRMRHVTARSRFRSNPNINSYASYYYHGGIPVVRPVSPGDPGNPYLNDDFDRAVERNQYNGD
jgi:hypothetical protein